jgi:hypothetical protein
MLARYIMEVMKGHWGGIWALLVLGLLAEFSMALVAVVYLSPLLLCMALCMLYLFLLMLATLHAGYQVFSEPSPRPSI